VIRPREDDDEDSHASAGDLYFYHPDHLGSTQFVTDARGEVTQHLEYFPFGEVWVDERKGSARSDLAFSGRELDAETGLYYFGARYQDPRLGQFLSVDPTSSGTGEQLADALPAALNAYAYAFNNPVRMVVPGGLRPEWWSSLSQTLGRFGGVAGPSVGEGMAMSPPEISNSDSPVRASAVRAAADMAGATARPPNDPVSQTRPRSNAISGPSTRPRANAVSDPPTRPRANAIPFTTRERSNAVFGEGPSAYLDGPAPVVLGENMVGRVTPYARGIGAETIVDWLGGRQWTQQLNDAYISFLKSEGRRVIDIGPDFGRRLQFKMNPPTDRSPRPVYESERENLLQGGQANYAKRFERTGKYEGGVRGFDVVGRREGGPVGLN
jgi:RHS repeat-associated protein